MKLMDLSIMICCLFMWLDDVLCLSHAPKPILNKIGKLLFRVKEESLGEPNHYLGANVSKYQLPERCECWSMSSHHLKCSKEF